MEHEDLQCGYRSNGRGMFSVWDICRMEQGDLQFGLSVEWNRVVFSLWYRWNGALSPSVRCTGPMDREVSSFGYGSNGTRSS